MDCWKSPSGVQGQSPWWGVRGQSPRNGCLMVEPPEAEQVLMTIKTFLSEILLIKSCIIR